MSNDTPATPAGWYPDGATPGMQRYWDGTAWSHDQVRPIPEPGDTTVTGLAPVPAKKPWYKRKRIVIPAAVLAVFILIPALASLGNGTKDDTPSAVVQTTEEEPAEEEVAAPVDTRVETPSVVGLTVGEARAASEAAGFPMDTQGEVGDDWLVTQQNPAAGALAEPGAHVTIAAEAPKPVYTVAQESAIRSAASYLSFKGFSRAGLIGQLTSEYGEGFAPEDAEFAVAAIEASGGVDWNQEAKESAESYLDFKGFSRSGLFDQLTSEYGEQFTPDQANFALDAVGLH